MANEYEKGSEMRLEGEGAASEGQHVNTSSLSYESDGREEHCEDGIDEGS